MTGTRVHLVVRSIHRIAIVPLSSIVRLDADDNYVRISADREYRRKGTLAALIANLGPGPFLRVHRSHAVNLHAVRELKGKTRGATVARSPRSEFSPTNANRKRGALSPRSTTRTI